MKKAKSQWKRLTRQILALGLAVVLVSGMTDFSVLAAAAQKSTAASEETVTEKTVENPAAENTEVETVSGDTASAEPKVQIAANSADDEAGIAVQADEGTTSDLIEVKIDNMAQNYATFTDAMNAVAEALKSEECWIKIKLLADVENIDTVWFQPDNIYENAKITVDLNGYTLGSEPKTSNEKYMRFRYCDVTLEDNSANSQGMSYMYICIDDEDSTVTVKNGNYTLVGISYGGKGFFNGGYVGTIEARDDGSSCTVTNGEYGRISVSDASILEISGKNITVNSLSVSAKTTATVKGGTYKAIYGDLSNIVKNPYVLVSTNENTAGEILNISGKNSARNVKVTTVTGDRTAPTWTADDDSDEEYGIKIKDTWYNTLLSTVNFEDHVYNDTTLTCTIRANDTDVKKICYYTQVVEAYMLKNFTPLSSERLDELRDNGKFTSVETGGKDAITASLKMEYSNSYMIVLYACAVDKIGNRSEYISTNGILIDNVDPTIDIDEYKTKVSSTEVTVSLNVSENATLIYFYYDEYTAKNAGYDGIVELDTAVENYIETGYKEYINNRGRFNPFIKEQDGIWGKWVPAVSDGGKVPITTDNKVEVPLRVAEVKEGENQFTISGLKPYTTTRIIIQVMDKAGNLCISNNSYFQHVYIITDKLTPQIVTEPSVTGVYGDKPSDLNITGGKVSYNGNEIAGTWKITEDSSTRFEIGTNLKCAVTFTPEDAQYEAVATQVVPTIAKRPITITITKDKLTKTYEETLSAITADDFVISDGELAFADTTDTIAESLSYVTDAAETTADVGTYNFTVKSDSQNYDITVQYPDNATHGTVEVQQAKGVIEGSNTFNDTVTKTYKDDTEFDISDWVTANHAESKISYEVVDSKTSIDSTYSYKVANDYVVTVTPEGKVEIHNAGTATIRISLPESKNYSKSNDLEIKVTVDQKIIKLDPVTKDYLYTQGTKENYERLSVESFLPDDYGIRREILSYVTLFVEDSSGIFGENPKIEYIDDDKTIKYIVKSGSLGSTAQIKLDSVKTTNYIIDGGIIINVKLVNLIPTALNGDRIVLKNNTLTYGQALSELKFGDNTFTDSDTGEEVPGTLAWRSPEATPDAGTYEAEWVFTPTDDKTYIGCTGTVTITVNKADPSEVTAPVFNLYYYRPTPLSENLRLSTSSYVKQQGVVKDINGKELEGTWSWVEPDTVPEVGKQTLKVRFTPTDQNYNSVESSAALEVSKAYLYIEDSMKPSVPNAYTHGDYLYSQNPQNGKAGYYNYLGIIQPVEGTFSWYEENVQLSYVENKNHNKTYRVMFIPKEQDHYYEQMTRITIVVNQAEYPPTVPGDLNVKNSCKTLGDVELPEGWSFAEADLDKALEVDTPVTVTVTYKDTYNYINSTKEITITRSACDHEKTERRNVIKATCMTEGNTGDLWCLVCNTKLEDGTVTPKDSTNHTALTSKVIKQPTTSEEGIMEYTCSDCGYTATKAIAKIASSSSDSDDDDDDDLAPAPTPAPTATPAPAVTPVRPNRTPVKPTVKEEPKTPAPFLRGENGKEGWEIITDAVTEAAEGDTVVVDMNGSTVVPGDIFHRIRGKDITVEFDLGNGILWKVNGQSVEKGNVGDIDFSVRTGDEANDTIPVEIINNLTGERTYMNLSLVYEGEFGFEAVLSLNVGAANVGLYANLFYYNESTKELEYLCTGQIGQDGGAELTFTHASEYTIVIDEQPMGETAGAPEVAPVEDNKENGTTVSVIPETEDSNIAVWVILGIMIAAAFIVISVIIAARRNKEEE